MAKITLAKETVQPTPRATVVRIAGQADHENTRQIEDYFEEMMQSEQPQHVLLDLSGLLFGDSSFLSLLILWRERTRNAGGKLILYGLRPEIHSLLRVVSFDRILPIHPDQAAALAAVAPQG